VLVENVPGDHVTIQLADGALRRFSAGEVASVLELGARAAPAAPAAVSPPLAKVEVELSSTHPDARLFQIAVLNDARPGAPMTATNTEICGPPCARELPPGTYKIVGPDLRPSPTFHLESSARHVNIAADPVTDGRRTGGAALLIGSGIAGTVGPYMLIYGGMISWFQSETMQESGPWKGIAVAGGVLTFAAVAMLIPGLVLFLKDSTVAVNKTAP
jgi:hypothetical protein